MSNRVISVFTHWYGTWESTREGAGATGVLILSRSIAEADADSASKILVLKLHFGCNVAYRPFPTALVHSPSLVRYQRGVRKGHMVLCLR